MNKMAEVAKLLGVELEKEFIVKSPKGYNVISKLNNEGLWGYSQSTGEYRLCNIDLCKLITGEFEIKKKPWKAELNEGYFIPAPTMGGLYKLTKNVISSEDNEFYKRGLMCKTKEQAIKTAEAMIKVAREMQGFDE